MWETRFDPWVGKIPWRKAWQPTPVFLPRESPWTEESGGLQSMGSQRVEHNWATKTSTSQMPLGAESSFQSTPWPQIMAGYPLWSVPHWEGWVTSVKTQPQSGVEHSDLEKSCGPGGRGHLQARWDKGVTAFPSHAAVKGGAAGHQDLVQASHVSGDVKEPIGMVLPFRNLKRK